MRSRGAVERLGQLIGEPVRARSRIGGAALNGLAVVMVAATLFSAGLVPSTALAGAERLGTDGHVRHCER